MPGLSILESAMALVQLAPATLSVGFLGMSNRNSGVTWNWKWCQNPLGQKFAMHFQGCSANLLPGIYAVLDAEAMILKHVSIVEGEV